MINPNDIYMNHDTIDDNTTTFAHDYDANSTGTNGNDYDQDFSYADIGEDNGTIMTMTTLRNQSIPTTTNTTGTTTTTPAPTSPVVSTRPNMVVRTNTLTNTINDDTTIYKDDDNDDTADGYEDTGSGMNTDKISSDDDENYVAGGVAVVAAGTGVGAVVGATVAGQKQHSSKFNTTGSHISFSNIRNSLRFLPSSSSNQNDINHTNTGVYDHRNTLIRSITTTAAATLERQYSVAELVQTLNHNRYNTYHNNHTHNNHNDDTNGTTDAMLSPEVERRVLDFQLAQKKRSEKYGIQKPFGIFGMYNHLANVRIDLEWAEDAAYRRQHNEPYLSWTDFDDVRIKTLSKPYFTYILVSICTIMLLIEFAVNDWKIEPLNINPMIGPSKDTLIKLGARDTSLIVNNNEWYRIISPLILHAGIIHYIINSIAFWFIGIALEQNHGLYRTAILFLIPGIGGNILSAIFLPQYVSVGASGGIFGLIGGCIADIILHWNLLFIQVLDESPKQVYRRNFFAVSILIFEILFNIMIGLITPFIDNFSHLGGMIYGICCAFTTLETVTAKNFFGVVQSSTFDKIRTFTIKFCGLIISIALIMVSTVWLATSSDPTQSPCNPCRYISCVPFPFFQDEKWWYCDDCDFVTAILSKNGNYYTEIDLTCPDDTVETIDISSDMLSETDAVRKQLPTYCREHCNDVYN